MSRPRGPCRAGSPNPAASRRFAATALLATAVLIAFLLTPRPRGSSAVAAFPSRAVATPASRSSPSAGIAPGADALRAWGTTDAPAAIARCLRRPFAERSAAVAAVLLGAAHDPELAIALTRALVADDPDLAHDHGCSLLFALAQQGDFSAAAEFAATADAAHRDAWLDTAFSLWTEHSPRTAILAALALPDAAARDLATQAVVARWSTLAPHDLADFALTLPAGTAQQLALDVALRSWAAADLPAASAWINRLEPAATLDAAVIAVATQPPLLLRRPELAANWAESIFSPGLRLHTLTRIVQEWAKTNPLAARRYVENSPALSDADRPTLLADAAPPAGG